MSCLVHWAFKFMVEEKWVEKFKEIYKQKTGQELTDQEALDCLNKLITLTRAIYRPIPRSDERELERLGPKNESE